MGDLIRAPEIYESNNYNTCRQSEVQIMLSKVKVLAEKCESVLQAAWDGGEKDKEAEPNWEKHNHTNGFVRQI
jgi:hypothetical protein